MLDFALHVEVGEPQFARLYLLPVHSARVAQKLIVDVAVVTIRLGAHAHRRAVDSEQPQLLGMVPLRPVRVERERIRSLALEAALAGCELNFLYDVCDTIDDRRLGNRAARFVERGSGHVALRINRPLNGEGPLDAWMAR